MKTLVTGGAGFIGSHLVEALLAAGHKVAVVDDLSTGRREFVSPAATFCRLDIRDRSFVEVVAQHKPEVVYHLAARISVAESTRDPRGDAAANIGGTLAVLAAAEKAGTEKLVNISTATVYAHGAELPWREDAPKGPLAAYAVAKLACEHYAHHYALFHRLATLTFRLSNVYGPRQNPLGEAGVIAIFLRQMLARERVEIHGDGQQVKDFVFVSDVVRGLIAAADREFPPASDCDGRAVNLGSGEAHTIVEVFQRLKELTGYAEEPVHTAPRPADQPRMALDSARAREWLGWSPQVRWEDGLAQTHEWFRRHEK